jgi:hypothetical protein
MAQTGQNEGVGEPQQFGARGWPATSSGAAASVLEGDRTAPERARAGARPGGEWNGHERAARLFRILGSYPMKSFINAAFGSIGVEVRRAPSPRPGSVGRPIASIKGFLEDIEARGFSPRGIVDVGANRGDWTRLALSVFPSTPVLMIEPLNEMEKYLVPLSKEFSDCTYIKAGAGREAGELVQTQFGRIWSDHHFCSRPSTRN